MLGCRHSNSVTEEGGRNTGHTWTQDGQRRQAVSLARLHRLSTCPPGSSAGISYLPGHVCALLGAKRRGRKYLRGRGCYTERRCHFLAPSCLDRQQTKQVPQVLSVHLHATSVLREDRPLTGSTWLGNGSQAGSRCASRCAQRSHRS